MKLLMLINPVAGHRRGEATADRVRSMFESRGIDVHPVQSAYAGHLIKVAEREVSGGWDGIVAVGGDGTLFEVINGMIAGDERLPVPLGVIPVGTGNSFSRDLSIRTLDDAVNKIIAGKTRPVDLGFCRAADRSFYFINILGFGFVADVAHRASFHKRWGSLSYVIGVFIITRRLQSYRLQFEIDGRAYERDNIFVEISNSTKTGGDMIMAPEAKIDDGLLDVILLNKVSRLRLLTALPKIFTGTHVQMPEVEIFKAREMRFLPAAEKILTPDGEITGHTPITVSLIPRRLRVFD